MTGRPWQIVAAVVGAVIGIVAVRYLGLNAVIPALSVAACWWAFTRLGVHRRLVLPLAFTGGHGVWFLIGVVMTLAIGGGIHAIIEVAWKPWSSRRSWRGSTPADPAPRYWC